VRTAIVTHELLPKGLHLESLNIETGRVSIRVASGGSRSRRPVCGRGSSRAHSRYSRPAPSTPGAPGRGRKAFQHFSSLPGPVRARRRRRGSGLPSRIKAMLQRPLGFPTIEYQGHKSFRELLFSEGG
jgi:hypothetical protein